jgi:transcriptional regulator with XRE-family HTH domain
VESVRARQAAADKTDTFVDAESTVALVGNRIREMRVERNLTLQALAERTGLSSSMLSLVERGKTSPSIGTLVAISYALGVHMTDLFDDDGAEERQPVVRFDDQQVYVTGEGVQRRVLRSDDGLGIELVMNEYEPGTGSGEEPVHHEGHECGVVLEGTLTVEVDGSTFELEPGDCIAYDSHLPHKIVNNGVEHVRAVWLNLER